MDGEQWNNLKLKKYQSEMNEHLMDINMPEMDGYTLTAKIRRVPAYTNIPVIALTANVMKGDRERTLEAGCDGYIQKPVDVDTFPEQIAKFLMR